MIDIVVRSLYERSDDCRWWGLTPGLRQTLAAPGQDLDIVGKINAILNYINRRYTVYTRGSTRRRVRRHVRCAASRISTRRRSTATAPPMYHAAMLHGAPGDKEGITALFVDRRCRHSPPAAARRASFT